MVSLMTEAQNVTAVELVDIVASSGDLAYLGRRGKEPFGLRWIDPTSGLDRKLASVAGNGTRALGGWTVESIRHLLRSSSPRSR